MTSSQFSSSPTQDDYLREMHRNILSHGIKPLPAIAPEVREKLLSKLPSDKQGLVNFDVKAVNVMIKAANSMSESDFVAFAKDPTAFTVKLGPSELEALKGGGRIGPATAILGIASVIATVGELGLGAGGCLYAIKLGLMLDSH